MLDIADLGDRRLRSTVRQTSREAYAKLVQLRVLPQRRREVYSLIYAHGPGTSAELFSFTMAEKSMNVITQSRARFTELRNAGLIRELGTVKCRITGHQAILWDVTDEEIPRNQPKVAAAPSWRKLAESLMEAHTVLVMREGDLFERARLEELTKQMERREPDAKLRERMRLEIECFRLTKPGILRLAESVVPKSVWVNMVDEPGKVRIRARGPLWRHLAVVPAWLDRRRIRNVLKDRIAIGVLLQIES